MRTLLGLFVAAGLVLLASPAGAGGAKLKVPGGTIKVKDKGGVKVKWKGGKVKVK